MVPLSRMIGAAATPNVTPAATTGFVVNTGRKSVPPIDLKTRTTPGADIAVGAGPVSMAITLFAIVCVELWCRMFVDAPAPRMLPL